MLGDLGEELAALRRGGDEAKLAGGGAACGGVFHLGTEPSNELVAPGGVTAGDPTCGLPEAGVGLGEAGENVVGREEVAGQLVQDHEGGAAACGVRGLQGGAERGDLADLEEGEEAGVLEVGFLGEGGGVEEQVDGVLVGDAAEALGGDAGDGVAGGLLVDELAKGIAEVAAALGVAFVGSLAELPDGARDGGRPGDAAAVGTGGAVVEARLAHAIDAAQDVGLGQLRGGAAELVPAARVDDEDGAVGILQDVGGVKVHVVGRDEVRIRGGVGGAGGPEGVA